MWVIVKDVYYFVGIFMSVFCCDYWVFMGIKDEILEMVFWLINVGVVIVGKIKIV